MPPESRPPGSQTPVPSPPVSHEEEKTAGLSTRDARATRRHRSELSTIARRQARLAAVQILYQMDIAGTDVNEAMADYDRFCEDHAPLASGIMPVPSPDGRHGTQKADADWLERIVHGTLAGQAALDRQIDAVLREGWPLFRLQSMVRAVLRAGAFELAFCTDVPARSVMDEYLNVGRLFLNRSELGLVNGVLDALAQIWRAGEVGDQLPGTKRKTGRTESRPGKDAHDPPGV